MTTDSSDESVSVLHPDCVPRNALHVRTRHQPQGRSEPSPIRDRTRASLVCDLAELTPQDAPTFGQEAVDLSTLKAAGFPVQDGFVLSTAACSQSVRAHPGPQRSCR